jgi:trigger factor
MPVTIQDVGPSKKKLSIEVSPETVKEELEKSYSELIQSVTVKGFRKGHAPKWLVEKQFGKEVTDEVKDKVKRQALADALEEHKLEPMGEPLFENEQFEPGKQFTFDVTLEIRPEFEIEGYKGMALDRMVFEVTEEDIDGELKYIRKRMAQHESITEGAVEPGDVLTASVDVDVEGKSVWKNEDYVLPAEVKRLAGTDIEDLEKKLAGKRVSEQLVVETTLGEDFFQEQHRGKKARVTLTIKEIKRPKLPELNDELAKKVGFENVGELRERLGQELKKRNEDHAKADLRNQVHEKLLETAQFDLPQDITQKLADDISKRRTLEMQYYGVASTVIDKESEKIAASSRRQAERDIRLFLILEKIAAKEKIFATESDVQRRIEEIARSRGAAPRAVRQEIEKGDLLGQLRVQLREEKVMNLILEQAKITKKSREEMEKERKALTESKKEGTKETPKEDEKKPAKASGE